MTREGNIAIAPSASSVTEYLRNRQNDHDDHDSQKTSSNREGKNRDFVNRRPIHCMGATLPPGFLEERGERAEITRLQASRVRCALIVSRQMREFGAEVFGRDYCMTLGRWIDEHYRLIKVCWESRDEMLRVGDRTFFVKIFELRDAAQ
jgi:hypothetical protein